MSLEQGIAYPIVYFRWRNIQHVQGENDQFDKSLKIFTVLGNTIDKVYKEIIGEHVVFGVSIIEDVDHCIDRPDTYDLVLISDRRMEVSEIVRIDQPLADIGETAEFLDESKVFSLEYSIGFMSVWEEQV
jgi:hypothetical protein